MLLCIRLGFSAVVANVLPSQLGHYTLVLVDSGLVENRPIQKELSHGYVSHYRHALVLNKNKGTYCMCVHIITCCIIPPFLHKHRFLRLFTNCTEDCERYLWRSEAAGENVKEYSWATAREGISLYFKVLSQRRYTTRVPRLAIIAMWSLHCRYKYLLTGQCQILLLIKVLVSYLLWFCLVLVWSPCPLPFLNWRLVESILNPFFLLFSSHHSYSSRLM